MTHDRFRWPGDDDTGAEILRRASSLKIQIYRDVDGDLLASFTLEGDVSAGEDKRPGGVQLLRDLLEAFTEKPIA